MVKCCSASSALWKDSPGTSGLPPLGSFHSCPSLDCEDEQGMKRRQIQCLHLPVVSLRDSGLDRNSLPKPPERRLPSTSKPHSVLCSLHSPWKSVRNQQKCAFSPDPSQVRRQSSLFNATSPSPISSSISLRMPSLASFHRGKTSAQGDKEMLPRSQRGNQSHKGA